jgi:hypothetical protein
MAAYVASAFSEKDDEPDGPPLKSSAEKKLE